MYHWIVRRRVRALWKRIGRGEFGAAVDLAAPDVAFHFLGTTPISAQFTGRENLGKWFESLWDRFPSLRLSTVDVVSSGPPWATRIAVRLKVVAQLRDGSVYTNDAVQWITLRWGRMTADWVLEDTERLAAACRIQDVR